MGNKILTFWATPVRAATIKAVSPKGEGRSRKRLAKNTMDIGFRSSARMCKSGAPCALAANGSDTGNKRSAEAQQDSCAAMIKALSPFSFKANGSERGSKAARFSKQGRWRAA